MTNDNFVLPVSPAKTSVLPLVLLSPLVDPQSNSVKYLLVNFTNPSLQTSLPACKIVCLSFRLNKSIRNSYITHNFCLTSWQISMTPTWKVNLWSGTDFNPYITDRCWRLLSKKDKRKAVLTFSVVFNMIYHELI